MAQKFVNKALGLATFKNELTYVDGTLTVADNVVIDKDDTIQPRRGFALYGNGFGTNSDRAKQLLYYKNTLFVHYNNKLAYDSGNGNFIDLGDPVEEVETGLRIKSQESNGNLYFTTAAGIKVLEALNSSEFTATPGFMRSAGIPRALDTQVALDTSTNWLENNKMTAYYVVWGRKDANQNLKLGAPGDIAVIRNTSGGGRAVTLQFSIPNEILDHYNTMGFNDFVYQVYRDVQKDNMTVGVLNTPEGEMNLVFEDSPTASDFANGYVFTVDMVAEDFRNSGTVLYTNPISGEGIESANDRPPLAKDITTYKNYTFYANTATVHRLFIDILAVDDFKDEVLSFTNLAGFPGVGDKFKIYKANDTNIHYLWNGSAYVVTTYTTPTRIYFGNKDTYEYYEASTVEDIPNRKFYLATLATPSQNIDDTTRSLIKVINRTTSSIISAFYISGPNDLPGQMLFESKIMNNIPFYIGVNHNISAEFNPKIPVVTNPTIPFVTTEKSDNEVCPNRIYYSKAYQPEAVPLLNYIDIGTKDDPIVRCIGLREALIILKDNDGIFRVSGNRPENFLVNLIDSTTPLVAPDTAVVLNNQIYMLCHQGVTTVTDNSTIIISRKVEDQVLKPAAHEYLFPNATTVSFALGYESDRAYYLFLPKTKLDTTATQCFRYNIFTQTWSRWDVEKTCGIIGRKDNRIYFGPADINFIEQERKNFDRTDYADREYTKLLTSNSIRSYTIFPNTMDHIAVHDVILQEQYITIVRFNRVLGKLNKDWLLDDNDYTSLEIDTGANMGNALITLINKISLDDTTRSYTPYSGSLVNTDLRDGFNLLMQELNTSAGTAYTDYQEFTDLITYEALIDIVYPSLNKFDLEYELPLLQGECKLFKGIPCRVEYSASTLGDPSLVKQFSQATLMFDQYNFSHASMGFRTDVSNDLETIDFEGDGNGNYGSQDYGYKIYGGDGGERPFRTYVPRNKQRGRFIYINYLHDVARESFGLNGFSYTYSEGASARGYRR